MAEPDYEGFARELTELSRRYGISIDSWEGGHVNLIANQRRDERYAVDDVELFHSGPPDKILSIVVDPEWEEEEIS